MSTKMYLAYIKLTSEIIVCEENSIFSVNEKKKLIQVSAGAYSEIKILFSSEDRKALEKLQYQLRSESSYVDLFNATVTPENPIAETPELSSTKRQSTRKGKLYYCKYCNKLVCKLSRHLFTLHKDEEIIKSCSRLPPGAPERLSILESIRKEGSYIYNTEVNKEQPILTRRPQSKVKRTIEDLDICFNCKGFYSAKTLRHHVAKCTQNKEKGTRQLKQKSRALKNEIHPKASDILRKEVFPKLRRTQAIQEAAYDWLLIVYANKLCIKYKSHHHHHDLIRTKIRSLAALLFEMKNLDPSIKDLASALNPKHFDVFVTAASRIGKFDAEKDKFNAPTTAINLGTTVKSVCNTLIGECIKNQDNALKTLTKDFRKLLEEDYGTLINKPATESRSEMRRKNQDSIPTTTDIKIFNTYLQNIQKKVYGSLMQNFDRKTWKSLGEVTLAYVQSFNRRRSGELERMLIKDLDRKETLSSLKEDPSLVSLLSGVEKNTEYIRILIRGKLNRTVPVILPKFCIQCIELFLKHRSAAGVPDTNPYVFGIFGRHTYLRACNILREYSQRSGVRCPSLIRGTNLRKQLATFSKARNLGQEQVSDLANFMGHDEAIHRKVYRLPIATRELLTMPTLLEEAGGMANQTCETLVHSSQENISRQEPSLPINIEEENCVAGPSHLNQQIDENSDTILSDASDHTNMTDTVGRCVTPERFSQKKTWSTPERTEGRRLFNDCIKNSTLPSTSLCFETSRKNAILGKRTPAQIKSWVSNQIKRKTLGKCNTWTTPEKHKAREVFKHNLNIRKLPKMDKCKEISEEDPILSSKSAKQLYAWVNNQLRRNNK